MSHCHGSDKKYLPHPFDPSRWPNVRGDSGVRYVKIFYSLGGDVRGKRILDFGCAEGFFGFNFLKDGVDNVDFVDNDLNCLKTIREVAEEYGYSNNVYTYDEVPSDRNYDIAIVLSLWGVPGVPSKDKLLSMADILFISTAGPGGSGNQNVINTFKDLRVTPIHTGYEERTIFKIEK